MIVATAEFENIYLLLFTKQLEWFIVAPDFTLFVKDVDFCVMCSIESKVVASV